jgi:hypothetical protein
MRTKKIKIITVFLLILSFSAFFQTINANSEKIDIDNTFKYNKETKMDSFNYQYIYILFYMGRIKNLDRGENSISFDSVKLWRASYLKASDGSFWDLSISHYEEAIHKLDDYNFIGILTKNIIYGIFYKIV